MWLFFSDGVLMPALLPPAVLAARKTPDIAEAADNGWELQVRGRVREHLEAFIHKYMDGPHSKIYESPDKDYNVRFYTTRQAYGEALLRMSLAIDYTKFKDTATEPKYHSLLIRIWSASTSLAQAGGFYGPRSADNPRGYPARPKRRGNPRNKRWEPDLFDSYEDDLHDDVGPQTYRSQHSMTDAEWQEWWNNS